MTAFDVSTRGPAELRGQAPRLLRRMRSRPLAIVAVGYLVMVTISAVAASLLAPYDPTTTDLEHVLSGPSSAHLLGTDSLGRDVLSRLMFGGQISLAGVAVAVVTVLLLGVSAGLVAGFAQGWADRVISWFIEVVLSVPVIVTLLVVLAVVGSNETAAMVTVGVLGAPGLARVVRGATLVVRQELYIAAARVAGLPNWRIVIGHVLPRIAGPIIVQASIFAGAALLAETGLGYLGLGVQPPTPTWGGMVAEASAVIERQPWLLVPPGVVIALAILAFGLLGDVMRDSAAGRATPRHARSVPPPNVTSAATATDAPAPEGALLALRDVTVELPRGGGATSVLEDVTLDIASGETVGLVGESGCGKSMVGRAILGLLPAGGRLTSGTIYFDGREVTGLSQCARRAVRGSGIALVSQEPFESLDPLFTIGRQVDEFVRRHHGGRRATVRARTLELLAAARLPSPQLVAQRYPHELSGGMAQRVAIAKALAGEPELLIADEPTTALDVTVQAEILDLLRGLQRERGMAILLISHDLGVIADMCQRTYVMYAGHVVEDAPVVEIFERPRHPYTHGLLASSPRDGRPRETLAAIPGTVPDPADWPAGCHFRPRCPLAREDCTLGPMPVVDVSPGHRTRCLHHTELRKGGGRKRVNATSRGA